MIKCLCVVCIFIVFDILTGLLAALKKGKFKSSTMRKGLISKVGEIVSVLLFMGIEVLLPYINIIINLPLVQFITIYIVLMEIGSIIENIGRINPKVAELCVNIFDEFKNSIGFGGDESNDQRN